MGHFAKKCRDRTRVHQVMVDDQEEEAFLGEVEMSVDEEEPKRREQDERDESDKKKTKDDIKEKMWTKKSTKSPTLLVLLGPMLGSTSHRFKSAVLLYTHCFYHCLQCFFLTALSSAYSILYH